MEVGGGVCLVVFVFILIMVKLDFVGLYSGGIGELNFIVERIGRERIIYFRYFVRFYKMGYY